MSQFQTITSLPAFIIDLASMASIREFRHLPYTFLRLLKVGLLTGRSTFNCNYGGGSYNGDIANALDKVVGKPATSSNDIFVVFLPYGTFDYGDCTSVDDCSRPSQRPKDEDLLVAITPKPIWVTSTLLLRVLILLKGLNPYAELSEAIAEPYTCSNSAWYVTADGDNAGAEICDLCAKKPTFGRPSHSSRAPNTRHKRVANLV